MPAPRPPAPEPQSTTAPGVDPAGSKVDPETAPVVGPGPQTASDSAPTALTPAARVGERGPDGEEVGFPTVPPPARPRGDPLPPGPAGSKASGTGAREGGRPPRRNYEAFWRPGGPRQVEVVRGRRSRRIVRRLDTWTVFKVSAVFYLCAWVILIVAVVLLWLIASASGSIHDIEKSIRTLFDYSTYQLHAGAVFLYTAAGGLLLAVIGTLVNTLVSALYNLISDVTGGLQIIVLAEDERFPDT